MPAPKHPRRLGTRRDAPLAVILTLGLFVGCQDSPDPIEPSANELATTSPSLRPANGTTTRVTLEPTDTLRIGPVGATVKATARAWAGSEEVSTPIKWWIRKNGVAALRETRCTAPCSVTVEATALGETLVDVHEYTRGSTAARDQVVVKVTRTAPPPDTTTSPPQDTTGSPPTLAQVVLVPGTATLAPGTTQRFAAYGRMSNNDSVAVTAAWTATGGTITSAGLYTAGAVVGNFRVIATASGLADTSGITVTTSPLPPPPSPVGATCNLTGATLVSGSFTSVYRRDNVAAGTRYDARNASWALPGGTGAAVRISGGGGICWHGGRIIGTANQQTTSWDTYHSTYGHLLGLGSSLVTGFTVEDIYAENMGDGIKWGLVNDWQARRIHLKDMHDDCLETDYMRGGVLEDFLFEGCYAGIASRPGSSVSTAYNNSRDTIYVRNGILWHKATPTVYSGAAPGTGQLFKVDDGSRVPRIKVENVIVRADPQPNESGRNCLNPSGVVTAVNSTIVWTSSEPYPCLPIPPGWTLTRDVNVYLNAVAAWKANHPGL